MRGLHVCVLHCLASVIFLSDFSKKKLYKNMSTCWLLKSVWNTWEKGLRNRRRSSKSKLLKQERDANPKTKGRTWQKNTRREHSVSWNAVILTVNKVVQLRGESWKILSKRAKGQWDGKQERKQCESGPGSRFLSESSSTRRQWSKLKGKTLPKIQREKKRKRQFRTEKQCVPDGKGWLNASTVKRQKTEP